MTGNGFHSEHGGLTDGLGRLDGNRPAGLPGRAGRAGAVGDIGWARVAPGQQTAGDAAAGALPGGVSLTTTVPREFVHRAAVAEVVLTGWARRDDRHFTVSAQWPRSHSFFTADPAGHHDPLLVAETIRQSGLLLSHAEFGVPLGHQFLMWDLTFGVRPERLLVGDKPAALEVEFTCTEVKTRAGGLSGLRYETVLLRDGEVAAAGGASFSCTSERVYRRMRGSALQGTRQPLPPAEPADPRSVGRTCRLDVVLSPTGACDCWQLRVDTRHPVLFDHPVDHVPGMTLLEAARQATAAALEQPAALILGIASSYTRYTELDAPCLIEACRLPRTAADAPDSVLVTGRQNGEGVFSATVTAAAAGA